MSGETDIAKILSSLQPQLLEHSYVFCTFQGARYGDWAHTQPVMSMMEKEGLTLVIEQGRAQREGLHYEGVFRCITLGVESSLEAVGLTAIMASALTERKISPNVVAGYHHDHVFVPADRAQEALEVMKQLSARY